MSFTEDFATRRDRWNAERRALAEINRKPFLDARTVSLGLAQDLLKPAINLDGSKHLNANERRRLSRRNDPTKRKPAGYYPWDARAEMELLRDLGRKDFWTFFNTVFGAHANPKGKVWIDPEVHEPIARWFQQHVDQWLEQRREGRGEQKHLAVLVHREVGKTTMITQAGLAWLQLRDPELSIYIGSERSELSMKMLSGIKAIFDGSDPYSLFTQLYGNWATGARTWTGKEIVHAARKNTARKDPSFGTFAVETSIVGAHPDVWCEDDPNSYERMISDTNWFGAVNSQVTSMFPVIQADGLVIWPGCIELGRPVLMADGSWKAIEKVEVDDSVYTTDEHGVAGVRRVEASIDQGIAETVLVTTKSATLRCTPWHPFLIANGPSLSWVRADALKRRDLVVTVKSAPSDPQLHWMTADLAWLCGVILGDGWIGKNADYACIARSQDEALNERILSVLEDWIPDSRFHRTPFGYIRCNSRAAAEAFRSLGLVGGAKSKRVPQWIFRDGSEHRRAFLKGFCEADGHKNKRGDDSWAVEISNSGLIRDLRLLARTCGVRVGMERADRERWIKAPNSRQAVYSKTSNSNFNFAPASYQERPDTASGSRKYKLEVMASRKIGDNFRLDRVVSVRQADPTRVWDLTVAGSRSFICDGLVVHNTRYGDDDHYGVAFREEGVASVTGMQTDSIIPEEGGKWHVYFLAGRDREGKPTTPKVWPEKRLKDFQRRDPLRYAAQVMNDPSVSEFNPVTREQCEQHWIESADVPWAILRFAILCDTAFWDGSKLAGKDETVFVVVGYPRNGSGDVYVAECQYSNIWRCEDFAKRLVSKVQQYRSQGKKVFAITDEPTMSGKKGVWKPLLQNYFHDASEPMPPFYEFSRHSAPKAQHTQGGPTGRLVAAANFIVDGHVKFVKGGAGIPGLIEQIVKIGQYMVNPKLKIDRADAFSDAFQPELYQPMRRQEPRRAGYDRGASPIDGTFAGDWGDDESRLWREQTPREPLR